MKKKKTLKRIVMLLAALLVLASLLYGFRPQPVLVQSDRVGRGALRVIVEEEGETWLDDLFTITSPAAVYLRRIELKAGDVVTQGQVVAQLEAPRAGILDPRSRVELVARAEAAQALLKRAESAAAYASSERERLKPLHADGVVSRQVFDQAKAEAQQAIATRHAAAAELAAVRAMLAEDAGRGEGRPVQDVLRAPISGQVLAVHQESAGPVAAGTPLLDIGDLSQLEVAVDVLSQHAVQIRPGTRVILDQWGTDLLLDAVVTRIAPAGRTEVSALGVEEQRVSVEARITSPRPLWETLGTGYRVLARFVIWEEEDVLQIPAAALFRTDNGWAAFAVRDGRAVHTPVDVGRQAGLRAQVLSGLEEGDIVISHPPKDIADGVRVRTRTDD